MLDPHRIQPFTHPPPTIGNANQAPPPQAYGIQGAAFHAEYGRAGGHYSYPPGSYPPLPYNGYWDPYAAYPYGPPAPYPPPPMLPRRDEGTITGRRLSERISGFTAETTVPAGAGLPPKPSPAALDSALTSGSGAGRRNTRNNGQASGLPPPPPPDAKEDPRAAAGRRVSYHDMDLVAEVRHRVPKRIGLSLI